MSEGLQRYFDRMRNDLRLAQQHVRNKGQQRLLDDLKETLTTLEREMGKSKEEVRSDETH
jgi:hypothetical protein